ncbi:MAG: DUF664 domain-containing protein [Pleurocapsa sp. SU_196_0]|nr:DUF664 domain-containing protein [Pleurocapsa sp. SU_196_0]
MPDSPFLIADRAGFTPQISRLVVMMEYARSTTLQTVSGLTTEELDALPDPNGNSIGMLLEHFVAVEIGYGAATFDNNEDWDGVLGERWLPGSHLGSLGRERIRGHPLRYYLQNLRDTRARTLEAFKQRDDTWLEEPLPFWGTTGNRYFAWFHVFEDEINHRGQMRLIRKTLPRHQNPGMLGIHPVAANPDGTGMRLERVIEGGPAALSGLRAGDEIVTLDGADTTGLWLEEIPFANSVGVASVFGVKRDGETLEFSVTRVTRG